MAARTPRRSFAAPFVVTLAAPIAACYVQSGPSTQPPGNPPPTQETTVTQPPEQQQPRPPSVLNPPRPTPETQTQQQPPSPVVMNPPRPTPATNPQTPTQTPAQTSPMPASETRWTLWKNTDGTCQASIKSDCPPRAMCNPPPPFKMACPENTSLDKPLSIVSRDSGQTCTLEFPMPACPTGAVCNPPRPRPIACPKR